MTLQELFVFISQYPVIVLLYFILVPLIAIIANFMCLSSEAKLFPWKYLYAVLIYAACVPGIFALTLCIYSALFNVSGLLEVNILVYFLPLISMVSTVAIIRKKIAMADIPGFGRLWGLMMLIAATFITIFILQRTHIWIYISGNWQHLLGLFAVIFIVFYLGSQMLLGGKSS